MAQDDSFRADGPVVFREAQRFRQWWVWLIVAGVAAVGWWGFIQQVVFGRPFGDNPAPTWAMVLIWVVFGWGFPAFFLLLRLVVEVTADAVVVGFRPLSRRVLPIGEIEHVEARQYNALVEYGGWGVKGWSRQKMAYNVRGNRGVELTLRDGRRIMLGSQRSEELAAAIESRRGGVQR